MTVFVDKCILQGKKTKDVADLITQHGLADSTALYSDCKSIGFF